MSLAAVAPWNQAPFGRVLTAMVTPFAADGGLDLPVASRLAAHLVGHGSDGLVLCGTTGESPTLSWEEEHRLFAAVREAVGPAVPVLAGAGSNCTAEAVEAAGQAGRHGADGVLVVVPYYNKPPQDGLEAHFGAIAAAAPDLPVMLYNIPGRTGCSLAPDTAVRLSRTHANIVAYKAAAGSPEEVSLLRQAGAIRQLGIRLKLNPLREVIEGQRLVVVDDSIVRGNTQRAIIRMLREAGAREVHVRISSPPVKWPCFYGIDFATRAELIANGMSIEQIKASIGADSLGFVSLAGLTAASEQPADRLCRACFDGIYPVPLPAPERLGKHVLEGIEKAVLAETGQELPLPLGHRS